MQSYNAFQMYAYTGQKLLSQAFTSGVCNKSHVIGHTGRNVLHLLLLQFYHFMTILSSAFTGDTDGMPVLLCNPTDSDQCLLSDTGPQHRHIWHVLTNHTSNTATYIVYFMWVIIAQKIIFS